MYSVLYVGFFYTFFVIVDSEEHNILEINDVVDRYLKDRYQTIPGVAGIKIFGERKYAMRLWMNPEKMQARGITSTDVQQAIIRENKEAPSGRIEGENTELSIRTLGLLTTSESFNNLIVKSDDGEVIRYSDIGHARLGSEN